MYTVNSIRNICLLGHSGSGKTALAESLLYMTGAIDRIGAIPVVRSPNTAMMTNPAYACGYAPLETIVAT